MLRLAFRVFYNTALAIACFSIYVHYIDEKVNSDIVKTALVQATLFTPWGCLFGTATAWAACELDLFEDLKTIAWDQWMATGARAREALLVAGAPEWLERRLAAYLAP